MKNKKIKKILLWNFLFLIASFLLVKPFAIAYDDKAFADDLAGGAASASFPYTKTFTVSAYYSPLPCQTHYVTGSYNGDIVLNGGGQHGADGSPVFPGMIAAPSSYPFGTMMDVPGIGIVSVHDRGGAIVASTDATRFDRLDVWMGYGDKGLTRALDWGKRSIDVVVYGVNSSIQNQVTLGDYSVSESVPNDCSNIPAPVVTTASANASSNAKAVVATVDNSVTATQAPATKIEGVENYLSSNLKLGDSGDSVIELQKELQKINLYRTDITGNYGDVTKHAVFKFQQVQGIITDEKSEFAGVFGTKTRNRLNQLVAANNYNKVQIAAVEVEHQNVVAAITEADKPKKTLISLQLGYGMRGPDVATLQQFLKDKGFFSAPLITQYYGVATQQAVLEFQKANNLIKSGSESTAGYVGPETLNLINTLS